VIGFRAGVLFGHASCLTTDIMKTVSGWLHAGAQQSIALDQAMIVLAGAAGLSAAPSAHPVVEGKNEEDEIPKEAEQADDSPGQADASPSDVQADASPGKTVQVNEGNAALGI
jgi:hypothetical protein